MLELVDLVTVLLDALKGVPVLLNLAAVLVREVEQSLVLGGQEVALCLLYTSDAYLKLLLCVPHLLDNGRNALTQTLVGLL